MIQKIAVLSPVTLLVGLMLLCGMASAATLDATGVQASRGLYNLWINENGQNTELYFAGVLSITVQDGTQTYSRDALCVDLFTNIYLGTTYHTTILSPDDVSNKNLGAVAWLIDNDLTPEITAVQGAGLQLAIWDFVNDNGNGFSTGSVRAATGSNATNSEVLSWAKTYEAQLSSGKTSDLAYVYRNTGAGGAAAQMLIGPDPTATPEPATMALSGIALLGLSLALRARNRRAASGTRSGSSSPEAVSPAPR